LIRQLLLHACHLLPLAIEMQLQLRGLRVAARQLQLQAGNFGVLGSAFRLQLNQLHLHLLQRLSQHARLLHPLKGGSLPFLRPPPPVPLGRHSRAAAPPFPLSLRPLLLLLPFLLRAPLPRLLFDVCQWPRMLHACELVLLVAAVGGRRRLLWG